MEYMISNKYFQRNGSDTSDDMSYICLFILEDQLLLG